MKISGFILVFSVSVSSVYSRPVIFSLNKDRLTVHQISVSAVQSDSSSESSFMSQNGNDGLSGKTDFKTMVHHGAVTGVLSGMVTGIICAAITANNSDEMAMGLDIAANALVGVWLGYVTGSALGVYRAGNNQTITGSFGWTLFGAFISSIPLIVTAPLGATIAFDISSRPRVVNPDLGCFKIRKVTLFAVRF